MSQDAADSTSALLWTIPARNRAIAQCRDVSLSPVFGSVNIRTQPLESCVARILSAARKRGTHPIKSWSARCRSRTDVRSRRSAVPSGCCRKGNTRNCTEQIDPVFTEAKYNVVFKKRWDTVQCQYIGQQLSAYCRVRYTDPQMRNQRGTLQSDEQIPHLNVGSFYGGV